jgi:hypothetical protein
VMARCAILAARAIKVGSIGMGNPGLDRRSSRSPRRKPGGDAFPHHLDRWANRPTAPWTIGRVTPSLPRGACGVRRGVEPQMFWAEQDRQAGTDSLGADWSTQRTSGRDGMGNPEAVDHRACDRTSAVLKGRCQVAARMAACPAWQTSALPSPGERKPGHGWPASRRQRHFSCAEGPLSGQESPSCRRRST